MLDTYYEQETHVDQNSLLTQINNDKATISRAMGQNRQLKDHMLELQDKLMRTSDTNASLANEVFTFKHFKTFSVSKLCICKDLGFGSLFKKI